MLDRNPRHVLGALAIAACAAACNAPLVPSGTSSANPPCTSKAECPQSSQVCLKPQGQAGFCTGSNEASCSLDTCSNGMLCLSQLGVQCAGCAGDSGCITSIVPCSAYLQGTCTEVVKQGVDANVVGGSDK